MTANQPARRGLTPVVGIVLLVAITLLLAATVAAFAFGLEDETVRTTVPTTAVDFEYDKVAGGNDELTIVHKSGDGIEAAALRIDIEGATCSGGSPNDQFAAGDLGFTGTFTSGDTITVDGTTVPPCSGSDIDLHGATVRVVWTGETGSTAILQSWTGPG
jgi:flagellin-like protein